MKRTPKVFKPVGIFQEKYSQILVYATQYELMYSFARLQEFYENPVLAGKVFTRQELQDWSPSYYTNWNGCNVPWPVALDFLTKKDRFKLDEHEKALVNSLVSNKYVIGVHLEEGKEMVGTIKHENAHARFAYDKTYREMVTRLAKKQPAITKRVFDVLRKEGYGDNVLLDEYQAYMVNGWKDLEGNFAINSLLAKWIRKQNEN